MIAALVPVKGLAEAKGRLAAVLSTEERRRLTLAMLADVLTALLGAASIACVAVVSPDPAVLAEAARLGALGVQEPPGTRGMNAALAHGSSLLVREGAEALLVVPADLPALTVAAVEEAVRALPSPRGVVIVPSLAGGTSLLAMRPPGAIPFRFGPRSFTAHKREAAARGLPLRVLRLEPLAMDIDGPGELLRLAHQEGAERTRGLLRELDLVGRLGQREET
ncbi:2-phospho-L-lactate guanylyltransferase [bacterium HR25]|nr:2-phospho-L-lactate guanylyltransferase [bacterium HR25]